MKFTKRAIAALRPKAERYEVWEDNGKGLGIRVAPSGRKTWIFMYRYQGKARRMTFGTTSDVDLVDAHAAHGQARQLLAKGMDPGFAKQNDLQEGRDAPTVADLTQEYIEKWAKPHKRSWREDQRILNKDVLPKWRRRKAQDIKRRDIVLLLDKIVDRGAPIQANRTLAVIRRMFNFAVSRDIINGTPCVGVQAPAKENQRDRVLSEDEIRAFWWGLDQPVMTPMMRLALKLQLVTAQRKGEIVSAEKKEIADNWWTIPGEKAKNGKPHRVPITPYAASLITEINDLSGESRWLFPSPRGDQPITPEAVDHALRKCKFDIDHFTPHDLRRTAASQMTAMGISRLTVSKILNHVEGGVTAVYDRHSYDKEKQEALIAWSDKLQSIINTPALKVISMAESAKA